MHLEKDLSNKQCKAQVTKIHKQFRHANIENISKLIKNARLFDKQVGKTIIDVASQCENCKQLRKPTPHRILGLSKATEFNLLTFTNLNQTHGTSIWLTNLVDLAMQW